MANKAFMWDGDSWEPIGSQITTSSTFEAATAADTPLTLKGATGQTADLLKIKDSTGTDKLTIGPTGKLVAKSDIEIGSDQHLIYSVSGTSLGFRVTSDGPYVTIDDLSDGAAGAAINNASGALSLSAGGTVRMKIGTDGLITGTGTSLGAWTSYTPFLDQGASANINKTVNYAKYMRIGKLVIVQARVTASAAGSAGSAVALSLPSGLPVTSGLVVGMGGYFDANVSTWYQGSALTSSASQIIVIRDNSGGGGGAIGINPNIAVATNDEMSFSVMYETTA